jgi:ketosteroid isomerase-like protein
MDRSTSDQLALRDLVDAYAAAADARDADAFTALFLPDATLSAHRGDEDPGVYAGTARLAEIPQRLGRYRLTFHVVTNHHFEIDGDTATGGALCQAHHLTDDDDADRATDLVLNIRYHDRYARTPDGWRFATRDVRIIWTSEGPATVW